MTKSIFASDTVIESSTVWKYKGQVYHDWEAARRMEYEDRIDEAMHRHGVSNADHVLFLSIVDKLNKKELSLLCDYLKLREGTATDEDA